MPDTCISLSESTQCRAYSKSSISTSSKHYSDLCVISRSLVVCLFFFWILCADSENSPFMRGVSTVEEFDKALHDYLLGPYVRQR